jgi:hypothetical protein
MLLFSLSTALGSSYQVELAVPSTHPSWEPASRPYGGSRMIAEVDHPDVIVQSTHPSVSCEIKDKVVMVHFAANREDYPTSFPFSATCDYGGETLDISVVLMSPETDDSLQPPVIDSNNTITYTRVKGSITVQGYLLPECDDPYLNKKYASTLKGTFCEVNTAGNRQFLSVTMLKKTELGQGTCTLKTDGGPDQVIHLDLSEAEI